MKEATNSLAVEFECIDLPDATDPRYAGLRLGIQKGTNVVQDVPCSGISARFACTCQVVMGQEELDFRGRFIQGPRSSRFIYLCWGQRRDATWVGSRRAKIPLTSLSRSLVAAAIQSNTPLRATICMTNDKGEPVAATLKPTFVEWSVATRS